MGRVLSDVRRRDGGPHVCRVDSGCGWGRDVLCNVRRRGHEHIDTDVQHRDVPGGLCGQLECVGRLFGYLHTVPHVWGVDTGKFRRRDVLCNVRRRAYRHVGAGVQPRLVPRRLRWQLGCLEQMLRNMRWWGGAAHVCSVHAGEFRRRDVLCDVRRRGHVGVSPIVQYRFLPRGLRRQLGRVGRVLRDVRWWDTGCHFCSINTFEVRWCVVHCGVRR